MYLCEGLHTPSFCDNYNNQCRNAPVSNAYACSVNELQNDESSEFMAPSPGNQYPTEVVSSMLSCPDDLYCMTVIRSAH